MTIRQVTCTAPVNIAVVKYWGKRDSDLILPTNSSLSVTLSQDDLHSRTTISIASQFTSDRMWLNGIECPIPTNQRLVNCLAGARQQRQDMESRNPRLPKWSTWGIHIASENNFPTAAGLASSASGYACLVFTLAQVLELPLTPSELSRYARLGSGSACRSIMGGFVGWEMGQRADGADSLAYQVAPETHWPDLEALILVVSDAKKGTSSTSGMQTTVNTSDLTQHRFANVVPERMRQMEAAIQAKDFPTFAELTMRDSNQFHATCLDTYPPIFYMNDTSRAVVNVITAINRLDAGIQAAYTFDAGPNAVIYAPKAHMPRLLLLMAYFFPGAASSADQTFEYFTNPYNAVPKGAALGKDFPAEFLAIKDQFDPSPRGSVKRIIHTRVGDGPRVLKNPESSLLNNQGLPKSLRA
ncbi:diphosphomevalonate decarboxylase [Dimargaris cristalligena]|uniref:Diphosphomevalonate decarboxylase n=1 Tax=Dimargaris cristalligena TaxID=215637 RepID=A0A4P9ZYY1_9FUNG|nr:diphosphomevalonate decarboxylase [Dimargaris cristalligena]RKP38182.1 Diphosphomevalonate decarboxylase [Dimargaris cristalligena]|eukprot:RKP38182.1 Diphosphomevalonate decarboxylase [Dimargaris cristalligena]